MTTGKKGPTGKQAVKRKAARAPRVAKKPVAVAAQAELTESLDGLPAGEAEQAYEKYAVLARKHTGPLVAYRGGVLIALANVQAGIAALKPRDAEIGRHLPLIDRNALWTLGDLALAAAFAARKAQQEVPAASELPALMPRIYELRDLLLTNADGLARAGIIKQAEVDEIRKGSGKLDAAQDCVDLARLFRKYAKALRGKTPVTAAQVKEAGDLGARAVKILKPAAARKAGKGPGATPSESTIERDQLFTLLVQGHAELRRAGMYFWLDEVDQHVPALLSRSLPGRPRKPKADKAPATPPAPASKPA